MSNEYTAGTEGMLGTLQAYRRRHPEVGDALIFSAIVGSLFAMVLMDSGHALEGLVLSGLMVVQMIAGFWF